MRVRDPQTFAAWVMIVGLAIVASLTARPPAVRRDAYTSTAYDANGYRAWAELLGHEGVTTARFRRRPIELDAATGTLVSAVPPPFTAGSGTRTAADIAALAAWVRSGGRLIYLGRDPAVTDAENRQLQLPLVLPNVGAPGRLAGGFARDVRSVWGVGTNRMLLAEHAGSALLSDRNGAIVVRYALGRGAVTAVSDAVPFTNVNLARADNARLAYRLIAPARTGDVVAFDDALHGALIDRPWYRALPVPVLVALGIGSVALVLGLIGSALPSGPPLRLDAVREPTSAEFVDALAALYERTAARDAVRTILARDALAAAARSAGVPADAPPAALLERLGERGGGADVRRLIAQLDAPLTGDAGLLAGARLAAIVRKDYVHDSNGDGPRAAFTGRTRTGRRR